MKQSKQASSIKHEHAIFDKQKLEMVGTAFWVTREIEKEFCSHPSILKIGLCGRKTSSWLRTNIEIFVPSLAPVFWLMVQFFHLFCA